MSAASVSPAAHEYYLESMSVVKTGSDSKAYILSAPGLSVRTVNRDGEFGTVKSVPVHSGNAYYSSMFINPAGQISIYGSTDGKIDPDNGTFGILDWFYLETEN